MRNKLAGFIIFAFDMLALISSILVAGYAAEYIAIDIFGYHVDNISYSDFRGRLPSFLIEAAAVLFVLYNRGHYSRLIPWWSQVKYIVFTISIMMLIDGFAHFAAKYQFSRLLIILSWILSFTGILIGRYISRIVCEYIGIWKIPTIIIGDENNVSETLLAINSASSAGYDIKRIVIKKGYKKFDIEEIPQKYRNVEIVEYSDDLDKIINQDKDAFYILAPDNFGNFPFEELTNKITQEKSFYVISSPFEGIDLYSCSPQYFFGHDVMFLFSRNNINSPFGRIIKRSSDIVLSLIGLIITLPIFIIIALLVKSDGGPAFFGNRRIGKGGKEFNCWKFRSMAVDAEARLKSLLDNDREAKKIWKTHRKLQNDPRVTRVGSFIRKTSIDELPQLFNVLKGEMSLVGPRPILPDEVEFFDDSQLSGYISARPGVTGLWQVSGRNEVSFKHRVRLDSWYVNNWSIWCDIVIIFKTVMVLIRGRGAY
ncbi:undecaprenyl-phosphate galactose phosphotransferase WbaP [Rickettsiales bacterium]|nr:undecaprenyl-phosphate galactose phosphotransferase WbaP [Rickettsiales bacterium]